MFKRLIFLCVLAGGFAWLAFGPVREGQAQDATFAKANSHYKNSEFKEAIADYEAILQEGRTSAALYFNLGNSYFRRHQVGRALLNYERARRLSPRDAEIQTNMRLAQSQLTYAQPLRMKLFNRICDLPFQWISLDEGTLGVLIVYLALVCLLCVMAVRPAARPRLRTSVRVLSLVFIIGLCLLCVKIKTLGREALVVRPRAEARFAPFEKATTHFELSEGMTVAVIEKKAGWLKVERPDGKSGWIEEDTIAII